MNYIVRVAVRPRSTASVSTSDSGANIPVGYTFESGITQIDQRTASHPTMVQMPNGMWLPLVYNGVTFVEIDHSVIIPSTPEDINVSVNVVNGVIVVYVNGKEYIEKV